MKLNKAAVINLLYFFESTQVFLQNREMKLYQIPGYSEMNKNHISFTPYEHIHVLALMGGYELF